MDTAKAMMSKAKISSLLFVQPESILTGHLHFFDQGVLPRICGERRRYLGNHLVPKSRRVISLTFTYIRRSEFCHFGWIVVAVITVSYTFAAILSPVRRAFHVIVDAWRHEQVVALAPVLIKVMRRGNLNNRVRTRTGDVAGELCEIGEAKVM